LSVPVAVPGAQLSSCPDLIRASIFFKERWIAGSQVNKATPFLAVPGNDEIKALSSKRSKNQRDL
jgi:hypothetical protein